MTDTRTEHTPEAVEAEPDMSWIDIAVTHQKEVFILGYSEGWRQFDMQHWWEDTFSTDAPEHLAPGAYHWIGYAIGSWDEDEHISVTGGEFHPLPASVPAPLSDQSNLVAEIARMSLQSEVDVDEDLSETLDTLITRARQIGGAA